LANSLAAALAALSAGNKDEARAALIRAWRERRSPTLAALVDALGESPFVATNRVASTVEKLRALDSDDPRLGTALLGWLRQPPFAGASSAPFWEWALGEAVKLRDVRFLQIVDEAHEMMVARLSPVEMRRQARRTFDRAIAAAHEPREATVEERRLEGQIAARLASAIAPTKTDAELLAAVYAEPHLDGPRQVYGDFLQERGDARGEFIALQFKRRERELDASEIAREQMLLKQNGKKWLGALASVLSFGKGYSRTRFERGFVAVADIQLSAYKKLPPTWNAPEWSTVEAFEPTHAGTVLCDGPALPSLLRAEIRELSTLKALDAARFPRLAQLTLDAWHAALGEWLKALASGSFPSLRRLHINTANVELANLVELVGLPLVGQLDHLELHFYQREDRAAAGRERLIQLARELVGIESRAQRLVLREPAGGTLELNRAPDGRLR
jgi:uncharacterized protein (TIGR02996 family)